MSEAGWAWDPALFCWFRICPLHVCLFLSLKWWRYMCKCASRGLNEGWTRRYMINISFPVDTFTMCLYFQFHYLLYSSSHLCSPPPPTSASVMANIIKLTSSRWINGSSVVHNWPKLKQTMCGKTWWLHKEQVYRSSFFFYNPAFFPKKCWRGWGISVVLIWILWEARTHNISRQYKDKCALIPWGNVCELSTGL